MGGYLDCPFAPMSHQLDSAYNQLHAYGCELNNGLTNHAPMVAEALDHLGLVHAIQPWVGGEVRRMLLRPRHVVAIHPDDWQPALGQTERFSDWADLFSADIANLGEWDA